MMRNKILHELVERNSIYSTRAREKTTVLCERSRRTEAPLSIHKNRQPMARPAASSEEESRTFASGEARTDRPSICLERLPRDSRGCSLSQYPADDYTNTNIITKRKGPMIWKESGRIRTFAQKGDRV